MIYNKLVRDNIPDIIESKGEKAFIHIADDKEYESTLNAKLHEEIGEFFENPCVEELADILEVLYAIGSFKNIDLKKIEEVRLEKVDKRGSFNKRIILEKTE